MDNFFCNQVTIGHCKLKEKIHKVCLSAKCNLSSLRQVEINKSNSYVKFEVTEADESLVIDLKQASSDTNFFQFELKAESDELIFGCGEQFSYLNLKNLRVPIYSQEQGLGRGQDPTSRFFRWLQVAGDRLSTYLPLPLFVSSLNYCCIVDSFSLVEFEFGSSKTKVKVFGKFNQIKLFKTQFPQLHSQILADLKPKINPPSWVHDSLIISLQGGQQLVESKIKTLMDNGVGFNAVWLQDWCGTKLTYVSQAVNWNWQPDQNRYPQIKSWIKGLNQLNIKVLGYVNPFLRVGSRNYLTAKRRGFLISDCGKNTDIFRPITFKAGLIDLTNPQAYDWYQQLIIRNLVKNCFSGWMADFGEHMSASCSYFDKEVSPAEIHQYYLYLWNKLNYEIVTWYSDLFIFQRSAALQSVKYVQSFWTGDQFHDLHLDDGLPAAVLGLITSAVSGIKVNHFDIGGYTTLPWKRRDKMNLKRWLELSLFTPIMRSHEGSFPRLNTQIYDQPMLSFVSRISRIRKILRPYIREMLKKNQDAIKPVLAGGVFSRHNGTNQYQYWFGPEILVCPPYKSKFNYFLPPLPAQKSWVNIWTGKKYKAGVQTAVSQDPVPVFYAEGTEHQALFRRISARN